MTFLHTINGCDTVSSFLGCGNKSAWLAWSSCPRFSDIGEHHTNIAVICATRGIPSSPSCLGQQFGGGSNLIQVEILLD